MNCVYKQIKTRYNSIDDTTEYILVMSGINGDVPYHICAGDLITIKGMLLEFADNVFYGITRSLERTGLIFTDGELNAIAACDELKQLIPDEEVY